MASWNVRSLVESEGPVATASVTGRVAEDKKIFRVVEILSRLNVGAAAIQETWWFGSDCYTIEGHLVLSSGRPIPAEGESFRRGEGVAVILNKICQEAWHAGGCLWKSYSSRLMSVRLKFSDRERFRLFSAYAPTFSSPRNIKEEFYQTLQTALRDVEDGEKYILLGDFNAQMGIREVFSETAGPISPSPLLQDAVWCPLVGHHVAIFGSAFQGPRCVCVCVCVCERESISQFKGHYYTLCCGWASLCLFQNGHDHQLVDGEFADDAVLFAPNHDEAKVMLEVFVEMGSSFGLSVNMSKTICMAAGYGTSSDDCVPLSVIGDALNHVSELRYLGSFITLDGHSYTDISKRLAATSIAFGQLYSSVFHNTSLSRRTKQMIYTCCVVTVLCMGRNAGLYWELILPSWSVFKTAAFVLF